MYASFSSVSQKLSSCLFVLYLEFTTPDKSGIFFCKVYYADEFRKLRERIFPSGEDRYIRSLARCVKYEAKGGKSRSTFCKVAGRWTCLLKV